MDILDFHRPRFELRKNSAAGQRHHGGANEDAVQMSAERPANSSRAGIAFETESPAVLGALNQRFQGWEQRLIRSSEQEIFEKDNFREKGEDFLVERRSDPQCERTFRCESIAWGASIFCHALGEPATRSQKAKSNAQITAVGVGAIDNPIQVQPPGRI